MSKHPIPNTFRLDVTTSNYIDFTSPDHLRSLLPQIQNTQFLTIGAGSNLLFTTPIYPGTILHSAIKGMEFTEDGDDYLVRVGSGEVWDDFASAMASRNLWGTENLSLIPGEVGASAVQNIGAYGAEAADIIHSVETIEVQTGNKRTFSNAECNYAYRSSIFKTTLKNQYIVTSVTYRLHRLAKPNLTYRPLREALAQADAQNQPLTPQLIRDTVIQIRRSKLPDPSEIGSAGSFFMNPVVPANVYERLKATYPDLTAFKTQTGYKLSAAYLIDHANLKGYTIGGAQIYEKQPLVLINKNNATPQDIIALADYVVQTINKKYGVLLHPEVNYI